MRTRLCPEVSALVEIVILFLPGIPAYIWLWPNLTGDATNGVMMFVYLYLLVGTLFIGLRRWTSGQLGWNRKGIGLGLLCGGAMIGMMIAGRLALGLSWNPLPLTFERLAYDVVFYFGFVGITEELLFRGLLYRALYGFRGARLAIWGTGITFGLYHIGGQGLIGGLGTGLLGLIDGAIRWRAGGILGLIVTHGLYDIIAVEGWPGLTVEQASHIQMIDRPLALVADLLFFGTVLYLWKLHPLVEQWVQSRTKLMTVKG